MSSEPQPRVDESVPQPDPTAHMSEEQKRALELGGEVEHEQGTKKEAAAEKAEDLGN